jgi:hypothetical protein
LFSFSAAKMTDRRVCPKYANDECSEKAPSYYTKRSTLCAHYCGEHLSIAEIDYILEKTMDDYEGETECTECPAKNKFRNRGMFLAHQCHRHFNEETLQWIIDSFIGGSKKNAAFSSRAALDAVDKKVRGKHTGEDEDEVVEKKVTKVPAKRAKPALPKSLKKVSIEEEDDAMEEDEHAEEDGYKSGGTDSSRKSVNASHYNGKALENPLLKSSRAMDKLGLAFTNFGITFEKPAEFRYTMDPITYLKAYPRATGVQYFDYLQEQKLAIAAKEFENIDGDIPTF